MNKHKFIRYVSDETRIRVNECDYMVNAILRCIKDVLATGEDLYLNDFGKFIVERRDPRKCILPDGAECMAISTASTKLAYPNWRCSLDTSQMLYCMGTGTFLL